MKKQLLLLITFLTVSQLASAHPKHHKVKVVDVQPVYRYIETTLPTTVCYSDVSHVRQLDKVIVGSAIGGTMGNLLSHKSDRAANTIAGAVIGGLLATQIDNGPRPYHTERCSTAYEPAQKVRKLVGYEYWYRINGRLVRDFSREKPGRYVALD